jgi:hypothetical protein
MIGKITKAEALLIFLCSSCCITASLWLQLAQAKKVFSQFARGPACDKYMKQLEDSCERFWKNGRQLCEEISLTGNHCVNPVCISSIVVNIYKKLRQKLYN